MYNKIISYFETTFCIENICMRKHYKFWFVGWGVIIISYFLIVNILEWCKCEYTFFNLLLISFLLMFPFMVEYSIREYQIFKEKVNITKDCRVDWLAVIFKENVYSLYLDMKIRGMKEYLKNEKMYTRQKIEDLINIACKELEEKYPRKNWIEKFFEWIVPIITGVLSIYFTNNNIKNFNNIVVITFIFIIGAIVIYYLCNKIKNLNITPIDKRKNLLDFIEVLENLKFELD